MIFAQAKEKVFIDPSIIKAKHDAECDLLEHLNDSNSDKLWAKNIPF
jgi:hypothetical protein